MSVNCSQVTSKLADFNPFRLGSPMSIETVATAEAQPIIAIAKQSSTEPLKIPQPKVGNLKTFKTASSTGSTGNTITSNSVINGASTSTSSLGVDRVIKGGFGSFNTDEKFRFDSPQIFSIESRTEPQTLIQQFGDYSSAFGRGYRENGSESKDLKEENGEENERHNGDNSEGIRDGSNFESGDDTNSPFYSSDIDSDTSSEPPLLWNFADYFANLPGNDWCVRIPQCFIDDEFNLFELPDVFKCPLTLTDRATKNHSEMEEEEEEEYSFDDLIDFITVEDLTGMQ